MQLLLLRNGAWGRQHDKCTPPARNKVCRRRCGKTLRPVSLHTILAYYARAQDMHLEPP